MDQEYLISALRSERSRREQLSNDLSQVSARMSADPGDEHWAARDSALKDELARSSERISDLESALRPGRMAHLERMAGDHSRHEAGTDFGTPPHPAGAEPEERTQAVFAEAQRVLENHLAEGLMRSSDADRIDAVLRGGDLHQGLDARYVAAHGQPEYRTAFAKMLKYGESAVLRMTGEEQSAVQQAVASEEMRAMAEGTGSTGGFGLPIAIDPTMIITSPGAISPLRELASQRTISTREYRAITTAGTTATFQAELTEVADNSPTLGQPDMFVEKAQCFIQFSIEVSQDYPGLLNELGKLLADEKAVLEAQKFVLGAGHASFEPQGIVTGLLAAGGSSVFTTAAAGSWAVSDVYGAQNSLPPRWHPSAVWLMSLGIFNTTKRLVASASATEPQIVSPDNKQLLSKPWYEVSPMASSVTASADIAVYGSISDAFRIIDRQGMSVELVPHIQGASGRPLGERGLYAWWRVTSGVIVPDAARLVAVHA